MTISGDFQICISVPLQTPFFTEQLQWLFLKTVLRLWYNYEWRGIDTFILRSVFFQINALKVFTKFFKLNRDGVHLLVKLKTICFHLHFCFPRCIVHDGAVLTHLEKRLVRTPNTWRSVSVSSSRTCSQFQLKSHRCCYMHGRYEPISVELQATTLDRNLFSLKLHAYSL